MCKGILARKTQLIASIQLQQSLLYNHVAADLSFQYADDYKAVPYTFNVREKQNLTAVVAPFVASFWRDSKKINS